MERAGPCAAARGGQQGEPLLRAAARVRGGSCSRGLPRLRHEALRSAGLRNTGRISAPLAYELLSGAGKPGFIDALQALYDYRIRDRLPEIACPTLVVWGADDPMVPLRHAFEYEDLIPDARAVVFPRTGHAPMLEEPERFNAALLGVPARGRAALSVYE